MRIHRAWKECVLVAVDKDSRRNTTTSTKVMNQTQLDNSSRELVLAWKMTPMPLAWCKIMVTSWKGNPSSNMVGIERGSYHTA